MSDVRILTEVVAAEPFTPTLEINTKIPDESYEVYVRPYEGFFKRNSRRAFQACAIGGFGLMVGFGSHAGITYAGLDDDTAAKVGSMLDETGLPEIDRNVGERVEAEGPEANNLGTIYEEYDLYRVTHGTNPLTSLDEKTTLLEKEARDTARSIGRSVVIALFGGALSVVGGIGSKKMGRRESSQPVILTENLIDTRSVLSRFGRRSIERGEGEGLYSSPVMEVRSSRVSLCGVLKSLGIIPLAVIASHNPVVAAGREKIDRATTAVTSPIRERDPLGLGKAWEEDIESDLIEVATAVTIERLGHIADGLEVDAFELNAIISHYVRAGSSDFTAGLPIPEAVREILKAEPPTVEIEQTQSLTLPDKKPGKYLKPVMSGLAALAAIGMTARGLRTLLGRGVLVSKNLLDQKLAHKAA